MGNIMKLGHLALAGLILAATSAKAEQFSINDALRQAVQTHPGVGEASANRRATESELRQTQSTLLPQVRVDASWGPEKFDQNYTGSPPVPGLTAPVIGAGPWRNGSQASVVVRQILFDGFASIHATLRRTARVDPEALRIRNHTQVIALDAAEAYVNVVRYLRLIAIAHQDLANPDRTFPNVNSRFSGGRTGEGDLQQAR